MSDRPSKAGTANPGQGLSCAREEVPEQIASEQVETAHLQARIANLEQELIHGRAQLEGSQQELKDAHRHIRETETRLIYQEKMAVLGALVAGIAHEIKTPIGAIKSMQDTLLRAIDKLRISLEQACPKIFAENRQLQNAIRAIEDANHVIESGSGHVLEIVKRLHSFARMDDDNIEETDVHAGLDEMLMLLHHELKSRVTVVKEFGDIPHIRCNAGQINQVFLNLLVNATHAIKDKGTVTIRTLPLADRVQISIEDDGVGISPENLPKIFSPGFTTKKAGAGTGIGLSICCKIIHNHCGDIEVSSELGKGTKLTITLPTKLSHLRSVSDAACCMDDRG